VPSIDFVFKTDPLENLTCDFAVMGEEVNGKYYPWFFHCGKRYTKLGFGGAQTDSNQRLMYTSA
jgi:hypothetical protein